MSGKLIDRIALTTLAAMAFYLFFLNAWGNIPLACCLSFVCCLISRRLILKRPVRYKCTYLQAERELMRIATMSDEDAKAVLDALIRKKYPGESFILSAHIRHPSQGVSTGDVFTHWKKHRGEEHLLIAATCSSDPRAMMYARELISPKVAIVDKRQLLRIIRTTGIQEGSIPRLSLLKRLKRIPQRLTLRYAGAKNGLFGILLIALYLLMGNPLYLFLGLGSLFLFGCTLPGRKYRRRLF